MSKNNSIRHNLKEVSKHSDNRCATCKWYLKSGDNEGKCNNFHIPVNGNQLCDLYVGGYVGKYDENLLREYQQVGAHREYRQHPKAYTPRPTAEDYDSHFVQRYFVKYRSSIKNPIIEVDDKAYKNVSTDFYVMVELMWKIAGPEKTIIEHGATIDKGISDANRDTVKLKDKTFRGLIDYLTDYTEFAYNKVEKSIVNPRSSKKKKRKSVYGSGIRPPFKN